MADLTGQILGQYRLEGLIGRGGMASVYRARQESMDRDIAIKVMAAELSGDAEFVARFEREARVLARLQHPHILPVIDFGRSGGHLFLVMRLVEGGVLNERLQQTTLTLAQVNLFLGQIGSALEYAHQRGVIHRDLKPNNVLLDDSDNTYLTDFGIAKMVAGTTTSHLTSTGQVMGTPAYMAPEQWRSESVDARTDIYALGVIVYEMLIGVLPFQAETPYAMMYKHFDSPPPTPRVINPGLPESLEGVVLRALAKNRDERYASARQLADDFTHALQGVPPETLTARLPRATAEQIERATTSARQAPSTPPRGGPPPTTIEPTGRGYSPPPPPILARPAEMPRQAGGRGLIVAGALIAVLLVAAAVIGLMVLGGDDDQKTETVPAVGLESSLTPTQAAPLVILSPTDRAGQITRTPQPTITRTEAVELSTPTTEPTDTPVPSPTSTLTLTITATTTLTSTATDTLTPVPSETPRPTITLSETPTPDLNATAEQLLYRRLTQTADAWTDTPTPDIEATVLARLTQTAAAWTKTPTHTPVPTSTFTRVPTNTLVPSRTPTIALIDTLPPTITPASGQCNPTLPTRLRVEQGARTTLLPASPTRVRQTPGLAAGVLRSIPPGQTFSVIEGPQCADGIAWWRIDLIDTSGRWNGWIGEGQAGTYWTEPFDVGPIDCPGAPSPRMVPGQNGRVTLQPPTPNNLRAQPSRSSARLGEMQPGQTFKVVSGPVCDTASHYRYWLVEGTSISGWMAEGVSGEYWMEPWP